MLQDLLDSEHALESPIDLDIGRMRIIELDPLKWIGIDIAPRKLKLTNTGLTGNIPLGMIIDAYVYALHVNSLTTEIHFVGSNFEREMAAGTSLSFWRTVRRKLYVRASSLSLGRE